jgi:putative transposase
MGSTFAQILIHMIFSTKNREPLIEADMESRLHKYIGGIVRKHGGALETVGGMEDHVHLLMRITPDVSVADLARLIKTNSSKWIHETFPRKAAFGWQRGYGAFSVSRSQTDSVTAYITRQKEHHRKISFKEEFLDFLKKHGVEWDERYIGR